MTPDLAGNAMETALPRILVVDDEEAILETMTFTFQDDYEVHTSSDARRALEVLDENAPFAAVLTDQRMPDMSGVEFVAAVPKSAAGKILRKDLRKIEEDRRKAAAS